jgi:fatty acid desaturase
MESKTEAKIDEKYEARKKELYKQGISVIILLVFLTLGEYFIGAVAYAWSLVAMILITISVIKAFFVVRDYMHVGRLFTSEEEF